MHRRATLIDVMLSDDALADAAGSTIALSGKTTSWPSSRSIKAPTIGAKHTAIEQACVRQQMTDDVVDTLLLQKTGDMACDGRLAGAGQAELEQAAAVAAPSGSATLRCRSQAQSALGRA